jgi:hypothetical protein
MAQKTVGVNARISADIKDFRKKMQTAHRHMRAVGRAFKDAGKAMTVGFTAPFVAASAIAVKNWDAQAKAIAQVEAGIRATGAAAGFTSKELQAMASGLQENSLFGDEDILKNVTAQLLTFTQIAGEQFGMAQQAALDLATRMDGDLKGATIQIAKALNDPIANLSAMSRSGIQFTAVQKDMIKSLWEAGDAAAAQNIILEELQNQFGGSAKAASEAGLGPFKQLTNLIGDMLEPFGKLITNFMRPFIGIAQKVVKWVDSWSQKTRAIVLAIGGLLAVLGPVTWAIGGILTMLPALTTAFVALKSAALLVAGPVGLITAAILALGAGFLYVKENAAALAERLPNFFTHIKNGAITMVQNILRMAKTLLQLPEGLLKFFGIDTGMTKGIDNAIGFLENLKGEIRDTYIELKSFGTILKDIFGEASSIIPGAGGGSSPSGSGSTGKSNPKEQADAKLLRGMGGLDIFPEKKREPFSFSKGLNEIPRTLKKVQPIVKQFGDEFEMAMEKIRVSVEFTADQLNEMFDQLMEGTLSTFADQLGQALGQGGFKNGELGQALLSQLAGFAKRFGELLIATGVASEAFKEALKLNGVVAIAAGAALVAAAGAAQSYLSNASNRAESGSSFAAGAARNTTTRLDVKGVIQAGDLAIVMDDYRRRRN